MPRRAYSAMGTVSILIECPHPQTADVTGSVIAWCEALMGNIAGADKADVCLNMLSAAFCGAVGLILGICFGRWYRAWKFFRIRL